mmetsp:Transcript_34327/g.58780  ORF Transcript_34327/g.58780 Transcript_34327/m.58780 type:complete len:356 (+) Transcript_34327:705-1772(+)
MGVEVGPVRAGGGRVRDRRRAGSLSPRLARGGVRRCQRAGGAAEAAAGQPGQDAVGASCAQRVAVAHGGQLLLGLDGADVPLGLVERAAPRGEGAAARLHRALSLPHGAGRVCWLARRGCPLRPALPGAARPCRLRLLPAPRAHPRHPRRHPLATRYPGLLHVPRLLRLPRARSHRPLQPRSRRTGGEHERWRFRQVHSADRRRLRGLPTRCLAAARWLVGRALGAVGGSAARCCRRVPAVGHHCAEQDSRAQRHRLRLQVLPTQQEGAVSGLGHGGGAGQRCACAAGAVWRARLAWMRTPHASASAAVVLMGDAVGPYIHEQGHVGCRFREPTARRGARASVEREPWHRDYLIP